MPKTDRYTCRNLHKDIYYFFVVRKLEKRNRIHRKFIYFFFQACSKDKGKNITTKWFRNYLAKVFKRNKHKSDDEYTPPFIL